MINSRRRWFGLLFLLLALGMVVWGQTWLSASLHGVGYLLYWTLCLVFTLLALLVALVDARVTRRQLRQERVEMLRNTFGKGSGGGESSQKAARKTKVRPPQTD